jgi:hypothetical protein
MLFAEYDKAKEDKMGGHVARMVDKRNAYRVLVGKPEGWRPLRNLRRRWEEN